MLHTLRAKLIAIAATTALAFVVMMWTGDVMSTRVANNLAAIRELHIPRVEIGPKLESQFQKLQRGLQDAVAAQDMEGVVATRATKDEMLRTLAAASRVIDPAKARALATAVNDYYGVAYDVSKRMVAGEAGEDLVEAVRVMQQQQQYAVVALEKATAFNQGELSAAFADVSATERTARHTRFATSIVCLLLVLVLAVWLSRGSVRSLQALGAGLERFGKGHLSQPIVIQSQDEIASIAERANAMATSLLRLNEERDRADWQKAGHAALANELRGELEPHEVAQRALQSLARHLDAPVAALYYDDGHEALELMAHRAGSFETKGEATPRFRRGEGLVGEAAQTSEISVVSSIPGDHLRVRSGLGESRAQSLVMVPLLRHGSVAGVMELALFRPWAPRDSELLLSVRETLAIAIEVSRARVATRTLLKESLELTKRLKAQEEELRATNDELQAQQEELHAQQEELRQTNDELAKHADALEAQRHVLEEKNTELDEARRSVEQKAEELSTISAYKSQFLANMSHELRTPLNSMLLLSNLLAENNERNLTEKQVDFCKTIHGAGRDLLALINQVLDLAKIEAGKQETHIERAELRDLADRADRLFRPVASHKGLGFSVEIEANLPAAITTDMQRVDQILTNLIGNAIKFTEHGAVALRIHKPGADVALRRRDLLREQCVAFTVSDTGIGIAPQDQDRVFAPFEQIDGRSVRRYGGTGLGLSIVKELATLLGGELQLRSTLGKGSTFTCYLPYDAPLAGRARSVTGTHHAEPPRTTGETEPKRVLLQKETATATGAQVGPHLLIIEDDQVYAEVLGDIVRSQGLEFVIANDGMSALRIAKEHKPVGIVLDVKLTDIDGWQVMEALRGDPETASIPVHFVSALEASERGLAMGAIGYLTKPATRDDLVRVVQALVPSAASRKCQVLVVEDDVEAADSLVTRLTPEGMEVRRAASATEALDVLAKEPFDCMVLDLALPDMDGLQFLQFLQEQRSAETPPVVVYTGRALSKNEAQRLEAYAEAVVLKGGSGEQRIVDELRLFARRHKQGLPAKRVEERARIHPVQLRLDGRKILVVDDDMRTVYALSALLRAKGMEVLVAETGKVAIEELDKHPDVDGVLMDLMMPEMDGYEAMRRIRKDARFARLPIIALTAKAMKGDREKCLEAGATDYLPKPVDAQRLMEVLHGQLDSAEVTLGA